MIFNNKVYLFLLLVFIVPVITAQEIIPQEKPRGDEILNTIFSESGEVYFYFNIADKDYLNKISSIISIDKVSNSGVFAYANKKEFEKFLKLGIEYRLLENPGDMLKNPVMKGTNDLESLRDWDFYPTYDAYVDMMYQFATDFPEICEVFSIGASVNGRELLMAKISDNVSQSENEPQFLYTGQMHGDELVTYILMLRLIDYLLENYNLDEQVTNLVDNIEIWINPLANPDGTYYSGNHTVSGAKRYNANWVDLNRNYPDPEDGPHPDGKEWQPETIAFMQLAEENNFVMSANTHSGAEVVNYPWDTWAQLPADVDWWIYVSRGYADTVHVYAPTGYFNDLQNGITNGYAWYTINGGRQDYMNYFHYCRESTIEQSAVKMLPAAQLPVHWEYNYRSMLNYMEQCLFGIRGVVTDSVTGEPVVAKVEIEGFDIDNSWIYSAPENGNYHRLLFEGNYSLTFSSPGYYSKTISNIPVFNRETTVVDVQLNAGNLIADFTSSETVIPTGNTVSFTDLSFGGPVQWLWEFEGGNPSVSSEQYPADILYSDEGCFDVSLTIINSNGDTGSVTKTGYINVMHEYLMENGTFEVCSALFYDSGGPNGNYSDYEDFTLTFLPITEGSKLNVEFVEFNVEYHSSCNYDYLKIYDGPSTASALIGKYCGTDSPGNITATNPDGALTFKFFSDYMITKSGWKAIIKCQAEQQIILPAGWSGISLNIEPENSELENLFSEVIDELIIIQGQEGIFWPEQNINTIGNWNVSEGYKIKIDSEVILNVAGAPLLSREIELAAGWNLIPVLSESPVSAGVLFSQHLDKIIILKEVAGWRVFWPGAGILTLEMLNPGKTYLLKVSEPFTLSFP